MTISDDVETVRDMLLDLTDEVVYEDQTVCPEDMYFISLVLNEYYESQSERAFGGYEGVCEVAWTTASELAEYVGEHDELDWLNAYFVIDGIFSSVQSDYIEYPESPDGTTENPAHYDGFAGFSDSNWRDMSDTPLEESQELLKDMKEVLELHVSFEDESPGEGMDKPQELSMTISHLGKRYAHDFPDEMLESSVGFEFVDFLMELKQDDQFSERDIYFGLRLVTDWAELRAKREHKMLCVGLE